MPDKLSFKAFEKRELNYISSVFSLPKILKLNDIGYKIALSETYLNTIEIPKTNLTIGDTFENLYEILINQYRCEYVYKNEIVKQILINKHKGNARLYTEVEIHKSKADVLIVNGTSSVYEIKTELDTFDRLEGQLYSYSLVFDKIYVFTHPKKIDTLKKVIDKTVGILILNEVGEIVTLRDAKSNKKNVNPEYVFNLLRKEEYINIIRKHFGEIPDVTPVNLFNECKKLFIKLSPETAHDYMVEELRNRRLPNYKEDLYTNLPDSLKLIASSGKLTKKDCLSLNDNLQITL